jgi:hypothetical protein
MFNNLRRRKKVSLILKGDYYIIFMNPTLHKKEWNAIRLIMKVAEINYCIFIDNNIKQLELHAVTKEDFNTYQYNPN